MAGLEVATGELVEDIEKTGAGSESDVKRLVMPILGIDRKLAIPFSWLNGKIAIKKHGQTLEQLAGRGGVSPGEAVALMDDWQPVTDKIALEIIKHRLAILPKA